MFRLIMKRALPSYDGVNIEWVQRSVRSERVTFGQVRYQPGGYCGPRVQRDFQLVLLYSGSCSVRLDENPREVRVGDVYLFKPRHREHFLFDTRTPTHHFWCSVAPACLPPALRHALAATPDKGHPPSECFNRLVSAAFLLRAAQSPAAPQVVDALAVALFAEFLNLADHATLMIRDDACVARALRHMEDHLGESDCLAGAQRAARCSENALIYKFRAAVGATPARHLWRLRTEKGLALLAETGLPVAEIADQCGFKNPFHFSRCVRRMQGQPPCDVRRRAWS
jgi:AraC-like DNA-binding protein/quercetin dioxygenase-like cupin family protein